MTTILRRNLLGTIVLSAAFAATPARLAIASSPATDSPQSASIHLPLAGPNRPQNVPEGYVITPAGYFHPSCVQSLGKGEQLLANGRIQHADGTTESKAKTCDFPHYSRRGVPSSESRSNVSPEINGWLENANYATPSMNQSFGALVAAWSVPPSPRANDGQVLYFFPGLEDIQDTQSILQPVLGWYQGYWTIASWNCCMNGVITNSPPVVVNPGDLIYGSITSNCPGALSCPTWNVLSVDLSSGDSTMLGKHPQRRTDIQLGL